MGCVSVSMSQIMHYCKYPIQVTGQYTYQDPEADEPSFGILSVNFGNSEYDYIEKTRLAIDSPSGYFSVG